MTVAELAKKLSALIEDRPDLADADVVMDGCGGCAHDCTGVEVEQRHPAQGGDPERVEVWLVHEDS